MRGALRRYVREFVRGQELIPTEEQSLKFRCQRRSGDRQSSVRPSKRRKRIRPHLTANDQRSGREHEAKWQEDRGGYHGSLVGVHGREADRQDEPSNSPSGGATGRPGRAALQVV